MSKTDNKTLAMRKVKACLKREKPTNKRQTSTKPSEKVSRWKGPELSGISYSTLCKWLECRERARLRMVEGLEEVLPFKHAMHYGTLWHACEEGFAAGKPWQIYLKKAAGEIFKQFPSDGAQIKKWMEICKMQFPIYLKKFPPKKNRTSLLEEFPFQVPITLPSGRICKLNGVFDRVMLEKKEIWLQENKTKGEYDLEAISSSVHMNLQTMIYQSCLRRLPTSGMLTPEDAFGKTPLAKICKALNDHKIAGTLYNIIRRPLSDRFAPRQKKSETQAQFIDRIGKLIEEKKDYFFQQIPVQIYPKDVERFERESLFPILEQLCDWWESIKDNPFDPWHEYGLHDSGGVTENGKPIIVFGPKGPNHHHWRHPFGVYLSLASGFRGDFYDLICKGFQGNLRKREERK